MDSLENKTKMLKQSPSEKNHYGKEKKKYRKLFNKVGRKMHKLALKKYNA